MIKRLRKKFILLTMLSLLLVLVVLLGLVNGVSFYQMNAKADSLLTLLAENDGKFPKLDRDGPPSRGDGPGRGHLTEETPFETRFFLARVNENGTVTQIDTGHIAAVSASQVREYAGTVMEKGHAGGYLGQYKYLVREQEDGALIVFLDRGEELRGSLFLLLLSCGIAAAVLLVMFLLVWMFSRRAIRPVIESMEKQKQFITDASHEIKTPLSIISANTEVLELTGGCSEWTESIKRQVSRLGDLVQDLLTLSRMEEDGVALIFSEFFLSDTVEEAARSFQALAQSQGKEISLAVQPGVAVRGDESSIRQLLSILLDNAVKYASSPGNIEVRLSAQGKYARLEVANPVQSVPAHLDRLFDRFYRADASRSRETGGCGIGLSVARAVAQAHRGRISAARRGESVLCFEVLLPRVI